MGSTHRNQHLSLFTVIGTYRTGTTLAGLASASTLPSFFSLTPPHTVQHYHHVSQHPLCVLYRLILHYRNDFCALCCCSEQLLRPR